MKLDTKHDSPEMKMQIESVRSQIKEEEEKNFELENQYTMFANVYLGQDNSTRGEMSKILNEYASEGMEISPDIIDKTDGYIFDNYAFTGEKRKKSNIN